MSIDGAGTNSTKPASIVRSDSPGATVTGFARPVIGSALLSALSSVPWNCSVNERPGGAMNSRLKVPGPVMNKKLPSWSVTIVSITLPPSSSRLTVTSGMPGSLGSLMPSEFSSRKTWSPSSAPRTTASNVPGAARVSSPMLPSEPEPRNALMPKSRLVSPATMVEKFAIVNSMSGLSASGAAVGTSPESGAPNANAMNGTGSKPGVIELIENEEMSWLWGTPAITSPEPSWFRSKVTTACSSPPRSGSSVPGRPAASHSGAHEDGSPLPSGSPMMPWLLSTTSSSSFAESYVTLTSSMSQPVSKPAGA